MSLAVDPADRLGLARYGAGYDGFQRRIRAVRQAFSGETTTHYLGVDMAVREHFKFYLEREMRTRLPPSAANGWASPCWTQATEEDFDFAGWQAMRGLHPDLPEVHVARAPFTAGGLRLYERDVYLVGADGYAMRVAGILVSNRFSSRANRDVETYSPYVTDAACYVVHRSKYGSSQPKNTNTKTLASAHDSMRRLTERFFGTSFVNVGA